MRSSRTLFLAVAALCGPIADAGASEALANKSGCAACHSATKKGVGPSYKEIAAKYDGRADAVALLADRVRKGSKGVWGTAIAMPPTPPQKIGDADLQALVIWVLKTPH